ncbi:MAG: hypothetical protein J1F32_05450 [Erysipelotrichales bacterium]|nr:hypothetical protein [Erysipelotrichales bacterium]
MKKFKLFAMASMLALGGALVACSNQNDQIVKEAASKITFNTKRMSDPQYQLPGTWVVKVDDVAHTVTVDWSATPAERFTFERSEDSSTVYANVDLPDKKAGETDVPCTLTATVTYNGAKATREFSSTLVAVEKITAMTVAEAKASEIDTELNVRGVAVNAHAAGNGFFLVDSTGAIYVYDKAAAHKGNLSYGTEVIVKGKRAFNTKSINGTTVQIVQMTYESFTLVSENKEVPVDAAVESSVADILGWSKDPTSESFVNHTGDLLHVTGKMVAYAGPASNPYETPTYEVENESGSYVSFYANTYNNPSEGYDSEFKSLVGKTCDFYLAVLDINTSSSGKTSWRVVPVKVVPQA